VRPDKKTIVVGAAALAAAGGLGAWAGVSAGAPAGALAALAGLVTPPLLQVAIDHQGRVRGRARLLSDADEELVPPVLDGGAAQYLRPERKVVEFWPRPELGDLHQWAGSVRHADVALVTGEGGAGKTRLALQLGDELSDRFGWRSYWVPAGGGDAALTAAREGTEPVLLILDYAETRAGLGEFLAGVWAGPGPNVRVLLLARSAGEWWQQLADGAETVVSEALAAVRPVELGPLTGAAGQHDVYRQAAGAFAAELGEDCPDTSRMPPVGAGAPVMSAISTTAVTSASSSSGLPASRSCSMEVL